MNDWGLDMIRTLTQMAESTGVPHDEALAQATRAVIEDMNEYAICPGCGKPLVGWEDPDGESYFICVSCDGLFDDVYDLLKSG